MPARRVNPTAGRVLAGRCCRVPWKLDREHRSPACFAGDTDRAPVPGDNPVNGAEPQAGSALLQPRGVEGVKGVLEHS